MAKDERPPEPRNRSESSFADTKPPNSEAESAPPKSARGTLIMTFDIGPRTSGNLANAIAPADETDHRPANLSPTILFTGFKAADRARLEKLAEKKRIYIRKSVCHFLTFLVTGNNAGLTKIADAKLEGATILSEADFLRLIDTGELP
jgi:NAD-dependent DNA ligase